MIKINNLTKTFDGFPALSNLDLCVQKGSIYGLVGTNGAGKTTIIKHLAGVLIPDSGEVLYDGENVIDNEKLKQRIGLIADDLYFPNGATIKDMENFYSSVFSKWNDDKFKLIINLFKLDSKKKIKGFSKGMKKQVAFALAMAASPDFLLMDEPIDGLDPIVRKIVWKLIVDDVAERQMSVVVSSHNLREMEGICDYIGIIHRGTMKLERELDSLKSNMNKVQVSFGSEDHMEEILKNLTIIHRETRGSVHLLIINNSKEQIEKFIYSLHPVIFDMLPLSLEEVFIYELGGENNEISKLIF